MYIYIVCSLEADKAREIEGTNREENEENENPERNKEWAIKAIGVPDEKRRRKRE